MYVMICVDARNCKHLGVNRHFLDILIEFENLETEKREKREKKKRGAEDAVNLLETKLPLDVSNLLIPISALILREDSVVRRRVGRR